MNDAFWQQVWPLLPLSLADSPPTDTASARASLGLDSLDFVELVLEVEARFDLRFSPVELAELRTVQLLLSDVDPPHRRSLYAQFFAQLLQQSPWR